MLFSHQQQRLGQTQRMENHLGDDAAGRDIDPEPDSHTSVTRPCHDASRALLVLDVPT
jgi:hypothetical protein